MSTIAPDPKTISTQGASSTASTASRGITLAGLVRPHVVAAVFKRNIASYFSNPAGYVFITLFVLVSSWVAFWQPVFFTNNLATLDTLNAWMPYLLLFFIPAITMSTWAEERRQGTDELLLTLPARDLEVVLGKYFAALGIYTVALAFSVSHVVILLFLGSPDLGVMLSTYLGYWLMGVMLIALGMVASLLSSNVTVAFILGAVFCAIPVFVNMLGSSTGTQVRRLIEDLSVPAQFRDFGSGVVPLSGVFYFVTMAAGMLYLNMLLLGRRHWSGGERSATLGLHSSARVVAMTVALVSLVVVIARFGLRPDVSAEQLHALAPESRKVVSELPGDRPIFIQAYFSPEVPREYVQTKSELLNKLREFAAKSGGKVQLNLVETELYSDAARDAEKQFGITPRRVVMAENARQSSQEIILGVAFTSGLEEVVIPFFDRGLPVEYEIARSVRVVSKPTRKKVGILNTDAKLMGGFDFRNMGQDSEWSIVTELKKQYEVTSVSADSEIPTTFDTLIVAQPSSLTQPQVDNLTAYVRKGGPTLMLLDPLPLSDPGISPDEPKQPPGGMFGGQPPPEPKGNLTGLLDLLGIEWPTNQIVWNPYNPHPQLDLPEEIVFVGRGSGAAGAFNSAELASAGLQEVVLLFPGYLRGKPGARTDFIPLLKTNEAGGTLRWDQIIQRGMFGIQGINPRRPHQPTDLGYTLAARIGGGFPADTTPPSSTDPAKKDQPKTADASGRANVIVIADLDLMSEQFFDLRRRKIENLDFDNVTFVLNCVDVLSGDDTSTFVNLRNRRPKHRTLSWLEAQTRQAVDKSQTEVRAAETAADEQLDKAQKRLDEKVAKVRDDKERDERTKEILLANLQQVEQRRLDVEKARIEDEKQRKLKDIATDLERQNRVVQNQTRLAAILFPPMLPAILGLTVFGIRRGRENKGANPNRLA